MEQPFLFGIAHEVQEQKDIVYTPEDVAVDVVRHFGPTGKVLDPCRGDGAFWRHMPGAEWCDLKDDRDFFNWTAPVDWIVSNPPYSIFSEWLTHSYKVAENIVYLIPINKPYNSFKMLKDLHEWGGIKEIYVIGPGSALKFPVGFAIGAVHFQRGYRGGTLTSFRTS
jgi:hypothetical protein